MRRSCFIMVMSLLCAGCFQSNRALYEGVKPLQPFKAGPVTSRDKDGKTVAMILSLEAGGRYRLTQKQAGPDHGDMVLLRFFPLDGAPGSILVAEAEDCGKADLKSCQSKNDFMYELVRALPGRVEWRDPDCSKTFSKLANVAVAMDSCKFQDRASLEKALRVAAAMPWQANGVYLLH